MSAINAVTVWLLIAWTHSLIVVPALPTEAECHRLGNELVSKYYTAPEHGFECHQYQTVRP